MVCQAAGQTKFRALKHENGIAGSATIIVRVIACFQPLQDCQVVAFGCMEEGIGSWFHRQQSDWQSPNLNMFAAPFDFGQQNDIPNFISPSNNLVPTNGTLPKLGSIGVPQCKANQPSDPRGWFYCLPRFRQAFATPISNCDAKEKLTASPNVNYEDLKSSGNGFGCSQKRFLVFDQSGDKTTLIFSSGIGTPIRGLAPSWLPKRSNTFNLTKGEAEPKRDVSNPSGPFLFSESNEQDQEDELQSYMHEDSEELDALLYSDEENDYSEDDEVTSTGHSPSTMTAHDKQELSDESGEEVASAARPAKRQKHSDGGDDVPPVMDNTKMNRCFNYESDAESGCGNSRKQVGGESGSSCGNLKSRKEKIRETISILEGIIPDGKGRDAIVVIDEAINYLRSLKDKAKALGLDNL